MHLSKFLCNIFVSFDILSIANGHGTIRQKPCFLSLVSSGLWQNYQMLTIFYGRKPAWRSNGDIYIYYGPLFFSHWGKFLVQKSSTGRALTHGETKTRVWEPHPVHVGQSISTLRGRKNQQLGLP